MKTARQYSAEIGKWAHKNFDYQDKVGYGIVEEIGELCHTILKAKQKIRITSDEDVKDALGDSTVFLLHWSNEWNTFLSFEEAESFVGGHNINSIASISYVLSQLGQLLNLSITEYYNKPEVESQARVISQRVLNGLWLLANSFNLNLERECLRPTWQSVSKRNWRKYPTNGLSK